MTGRRADVNGWFRRKQLDAFQAKEIRIKYANGGVSMQDLGDEYGVSMQSISNIIHNKYHTSTLKDKDGWPLTDVEGQIEYLKARLETLTKKVDELLKNDNPE
jgi:hypothetical protein